MLLSERSRRSLSVQDCRLERTVIFLDEVGEAVVVAGSKPEADAAVGSGSLRILSNTAVCAVAVAEPRPGFFLPTGTGPKTTVTGPDQFRYRLVSNRPKFKI